MSQSTINRVTLEGKSALDIALEAHEWKTAEILLDNGAQIVHTPCKTILGRLTNTCYSRETREKLITEILKSDVDLNALYGGFTPLMYACEVGDDRIVDQLLSAGSDPDIQNGNGSTAIMFACKQGHFNIVQKLLKAQANITLQETNGDSALTWACEGGDNPEILEQLLLVWGCPNHRDKKDNTLLMKVSKSGYENAFDVLIRYGADPNLQKKNGSTALMVACKYGESKLAELLIKFGADVNIQNNKGFTALAKAVEIGCPEKTVKILLENGADVNLATNRSWTPLMTAAKIGRKNIVKMLIEHIKNLKPEIQETPKNTLEENPVEELKDRDYLLEVKKFQNSTKYFTWAWNEKVNIILEKDVTVLYAIGKHILNKDGIIQPLEYLSEHDRIELSKFGIRPLLQSPDYSCLKIVNKNSLKDFAAIHRLPEKIFIIRE